MMKPMGPVVLTVIISRNDTTRVTSSPGMGPSMKLQITRITSLGSYFKNSTLEMGKRPTVMMM